MKEKILIIILIILLVLLVGVSTIYIIFKDDKKNSVGEKKETDYVIVESDELSKDREFLGLTFSGAKVESNGEISRYYVKITNNTDKDIELSKYNIIFKDKNDNVIGIFVGYVKDVIKAGEFISPMIETSIDLSDAYTLEYQEYIDGELVDEQDENITSDVEE